MPFTRPFLDPFTRVRIDGAINPSSVAQLALATRTTSVPSGDTAIARVTAAICGALYLFSAGYFWQRTQPHVHDGASRQS